jgi:uncharacterized protein (TIGR03382 family)
MRLLPLALASVAIVAVAKTAYAADDCPPGSVYKSQEGYSWCEPTVCENDGQCSTSEVCRPVALCMQVGALTAGAAALGDASKRLVVTQRCAPDKTCPQTTVCSDMKRCVSKAAAEKMGLLTQSSAPPASSAPTGAEKKSCGCEAVGSKTNGAGVLAVAFGLSIAMLRRRRQGA